MRIAFMADIHANREALEACLAHAREQHADRLVFLGDYVNYGADPEWVVATLMDHVEKGGIALRGNHDAAVGERGGSSAPRVATPSRVRARRAPRRRAAGSTQPPRPSPRGRTSRTWRTRRGR